MGKYLEFIRFGIVGILNTVIGTSVMFLAYNLLGCGYWVSSALNYIIGSIFSYFANKYFTFKSVQKSWGEVLRFLINISCCYFIAYGVAKPFGKWIISELNISMSEYSTEQFAMVLGMSFFVVLNYLGQKIFVFKGWINGN